MHVRSQGVALGNPSGLPLSRAALVHVLPPQSYRVTHNSRHGIWYMRWRMVWHTRHTYGAFYFVIVMNFYSEFLFAKWLHFGFKLFGQGGGRNKNTPTIVPFSVSVLALVTNKVETPMPMRDPCGSICYLICVVRGAVSSGAATDFRYINRSVCGTCCHLTLWIYHISL